MIVLYKGVYQLSKKRETLLTVAEKLFYEHGFHAIGLKQIITEADIAIMTLYNHFASKDELIVEVLKRREQQYMDYLHRFLTDDREDILLNLAKGHAQRLMDIQSRGCMFLRAKEEFAGDPTHPVVQTVNRHKENVMKFIEQLDSSLTSQQILQFSLLLEGSTALAETEDTATVCAQLIDMTEKLFVRAA